MQKLRVFIVGLMLLILPGLCQNETQTQVSANVDYGARVIARLGRQTDAKRQAKLVVNKISQLIKQNPNAVSYGISFTFDKESFKVLDYNRQYRRLIYTTVSFSRGTSTSWAYPVFPTQIHKAVQNDLDVDSLFRSIGANERRR
jgi:hypothetical protein